MYFAANEDGRIWYASLQPGQVGEFWAEIPQDLDLARIGDWVRDGESSIRYEPEEPTEPEPTDIEMLYDAVAELSQVVSDMMEVLNG